MLGLLEPLLKYRLFLSEDWRAISVHRFWCGGNFDAGASNLTALLNETDDLLFGLCFTSLIAGEKSFAPVIRKTFRAYFTIGRFRRLIVL
jgi:hypothetical protein